MNSIQAVAIVLAGAVVATAKQGLNLVTETAAAAATALGDALQRRDRRELVAAWNTVNAIVGTHDGAVTRRAETAIPTKHLLGKVGASPHYVELAGATDAPLYVLTDEADAPGDAVACEILGALGRTVRMTSSGAITPGSEVAAAAGGKVRQLPAVAGTYYVVGRALTSAGGDNDLLEVASCVARTVVVA